MKLQILDVLCSKNRVEPGILMKQIKGDQQVKVVRKACWSHVHCSEEEKLGAFHNQEQFTSHPPFSSSENTQHFIIDLSGPLLFFQKPYFTLCQCEHLSQRFKSFCFWLVVTFACICIINTCSLLCCILSFNQVPSTRLW